MPNAAADFYLVRDKRLLTEDTGDALLRGLSAFAALSQEEVRAVQDLSRGTIRTFGPRRDIVREGDRPRSAFLIQSGWACRYKALPDGRRQIIAILLPGDICDLNLDLIEAMDHSVAAMSHLQLTELMPDRLREAMCNHPRLIDAFYWREMVNSAITREWVLNVGQRSALERVAHLICEVYYRLNSLGLAKSNSIRFPMTQADLADATGLTPVHFNRMIKELREAGLIHLRSKTLEIPNFEAIKNAGLFSDTYLHLGRRPETRSIFPWA